MHPHITTAAASPPCSPSGSPPTTLEAHVITCLELRERALTIVRRLDQEIMAGIRQIDVDDGDCDLEPSTGFDPVTGVLDGEADHSDREPSLAAPENHPTSYTRDTVVDAFKRRRRPRKQEISRTQVGSQEQWADGGMTDAEDVDEDGDPLDIGEEVNEDGGDVQDEPHDGNDEDGCEDNGDYEPSLGSLGHFDQTRWGADCSGSDIEAAFVHEDETGFATEVAAIVTGPDGGKTIVREFGTSAIGQGVIHDAVQAGRTVREVLLKRRRGRGLGQHDNIVLVAPGVAGWRRH